MAALAVLANHVELAFQRVGHDDVVTTADENLADDGFFVANRRAHRHVAVDGHVAPAQQHLAFGFHHAFQDALAGQA